MHFADTLTSRIRLSSPLSVGIDPILENLPEGIPKTLDGARQFAFGVIDTVTNLAACVKLQLACYELLRGEGIRLFWEIAMYAKGKGFIVIADGKRNDIGSTADLYAEAYLGKDSPIDALTVNPYLGSDSITPYIERCSAYGKGIFVLVKTSNPSSGEIQDIPIGDESLHEHIGQLVQSWGMSHLGAESQLSCVGAVIGATYPEELRYLRSLMPNVPFLIPGFGTQGGTPDDVRPGFHPNGMGAIVHATRAIFQEAHGKNWKEIVARNAHSIANTLPKIS